MQLDNLNVFDLDGTLINVNSFKEISKALAFILLRKRRIAGFLQLLMWYLVRKLHVIHHLPFKRRVVDIFEKHLSENEKNAVVRFVFDNSINKNVFDAMLKADNCIISTSAPYAFTSRMDFNGKDVTVISSLMPSGSLPDAANFGQGKVENIRAYCKNDAVRFASTYTDCYDDQALIDVSNDAYLVKNGDLTKIK